MVIILLCSFSLQAELYLVQNSSTYRNYLSIQKNQNSYTLKQYEQYKGDYQNLIKSVSLKNAKELSFILARDFKNSKKIEKLEFWKIANDQIVDKGLFGKKHSNIWEAKNQWNQDWENKYAAWIENEVGPDFYAKRNISTDCADALVGLRWIFSRINYLPVANTLADSDNLFGHFSMNRKWSKLSKADNWYEDEVFLAALSYVMDLSSTKTVLNDGYPIKMDAKSFIAGTFFITRTETGGHAKIVSHTNYIDPTELPVYTLASTSPRQVRTLAQEIMVDQEWPYKGSKEILAFRWPVKNGEDWKLLNKDQHPNYSLEQFDQKSREEFPAFISFLLNNIKGSFDPINLVKSGAQDILNYIEQRKAVVNDGYEFCKKNGCPPQSEAFEEWSTPSRDSKLLKKFTDIDKLVSAFSYLSPGLNDYWLNQLRNTKVVILNKSYSLSNVRYLFENNFHSINPNLTPSERWGLKSDLILPIWYKKILDLLENRSSKIETQGGCTANCSPTSMEWISKNTISIDKELNKLYVTVESYCNVLGVEECLKQNADLLQKNVAYNGLQKEFVSWFNSIPKFHSDPRVDSNRRWGISSKENLVVLPHFETVAIMNNNKAVLDEVKIIDLVTNKIVYVAEKNNRLMPTSAGAIYSIDQSNSKIYSLMASANSFAKVEVSDPDNILTENAGRLISYSEKEGMGHFKISLKDSVITFRIKNNTLQFINEYTGNFDQRNSLLLMVNNQNTLALADIKNEVLAEFNLPSTNDFKNINKLKISDYSYPNVILDYDDQEWGIRSFFYANLETKEWKKFDFPFSEAFKVVWANATDKKFFIQLNPNDELPNLYAVQFKNDFSSQSFKLSNSLIEARKVGTNVYFIEGEGNQWGNNQKKSLKSWGSTISKIEISNELIPTGFFNNKIYMTNSTSGILKDLLTHEIYNLPGNIQLSPDNVINLLGYSYTFDTSYGEYYLFGGGGSFKGLGPLPQEEIIPHFAIYPFINKENLIEKRWLEAFKDSIVMDGALISTGKNFALWWRDAQ
jgi:hypothetical protein